MFDVIIDKGTYGKNKKKHKNLSIFCFFLMIDSVICTDFPTKKANEMMQEIMRFYFLSYHFNFSFLFQKGF